MFTNLCCILENTCGGEGKANASGKRFPAFLSVSICSRKRSKVKVSRINSEQGVRIEMLLIRVDIKIPTLNIVKFQISY